MPLRIMVTSDDDNLNYMVDRDILQLRDIIEEKNIKFYYW